MIWLVFIGTMVLSLVAVARVRSTYARYAQVPASSGMTGAQAAAAILREAGIADVEIVEQDGLLSDHYDPLNRRLVLSSENYQSNSLSAVGVAAHETGHAIQHQMAYQPLQIRMAAVGMTSFASQIVTWLPVLGMFTHILSTYTGLLIMAIGWGVIMAFNLVTLPVEFDASRRAKELLPRLGLISGSEEALAVDKVLNAAAWTYVAAFITSLAYVLLYLLPLLSGNRRDD
ncbi:MAG: peptidase [Verrucomicrobia bacterium]|nr:MAG: peptidase [Verrucomicrobiota bacterium]